MEKRFQVFVSSTYQDLLEERQEIMQALLELDCIPAGMELFPAANEDQWTLIKKVIDDCDYYILVIAGRYGSIGPDGLSYTEMEYRYALTQNKPVIGFIHKDPQNLPVGRSEKAEEGRTKLNAFRQLVQNKMVKYWTTPTELGSVVSRSLIQLIKSTPAVGWVRADNIPDESATTEILKLKREIEMLRDKIAETRHSAPAGSDNLSQGDDTISINYNFILADRSNYLSKKRYRSQMATSWNNIFSTVSPLLIDECDERKMITALNSLIFSTEYNRHANMITNKQNEYLEQFEMADDDFQTTKIQLRALGLIEKSNRKNRSLKDRGVYWTLTEYGDEIMTRLRAVRKS